MKSDSSVLDSLRTGEIHFRGQFALGTNQSFLVDVATLGEPITAVYKPIEGEQPLWDFPNNTLAGREVAAFKISEALGWRLVPPTVLRTDGPGGGGSLQLFIEDEPARHYFMLSADQKQLLRPVAVFDALVNNADRKGGHVLLTPDDRIQLIDHGICFHEDYKLRTVIWDFAGDPIPPALLDDLSDLNTQLNDQAALGLELKELLSEGELQALRDRSLQLIESQRFPDLASRRNYPWPLV